MRSDQAPRDDIVVVGIDDRTLGENPDVSFPLNRHRHARLIRQLKKAGAAVIAFDIQFTLESPFPSADNDLIESVRGAAPRVVLATTAVDPGAKTQIFGGGAGLKYSKATPAWSGFVNDEDGVLRHLPAGTEEGLDNFGRAVAALKLGHDVQWPSPDSGTFIDFPDAVPHLSFGEVERGNFDPEAVRGKIVVIGATSPSLRDIHRTAVTDRMSGPDIEAALVANALDDFPLREAAGWIDIVLILVMAAVAPLVALRFGSLFAIGAAIVAAGLYLVGAQLAFNAGSVLTVMPALTAMTVGLVGTVTVSAPVNHPLVSRVLDWLSPGGGNRRTRRVRTLLLLGAALLCTAGGLLLMASDAFKRLDLNTVDMRFDVRGAKPTPDDIVVVGIDDKTINSQGYTFPFPRTHYAKLIRQLEKAGAAVIAFDVQFTQPSGNDEADNALIDAVRGAKRPVVLATTSVDRRGRDGDLRRRSGSHVQPRHPVLLELHQGRRRRHTPHVRQLQGRRFLREGGGGGQARPPDQRAAR